MIRYTLTTFASGLILAMGAQSSLAQPSSAGVSYNHVGLKYIEQNLDDFDCNQDGLSAYGNLKLQGQWFATGELTDVSGNNGCGSSTIRAGGGFHAAFSHRFDWYGTLSAERIDPDAGDSDTGLVAAVGLRGYVWDRIEAKAELAHHTVFDDTTQVTLGGYYWITPAAAATVDTSLSDEGESISIGARLNF